MAILPIGATEQHSSHLPLATDTLIVEAVARKAAEKLGAYCLPALPYSISHMHRGSAGTVWLRNSTLALVIRDIAVSLQHGQFTELVLLNGHGGNFILPPIVQDLNLDFPDLLTLTLNAWDGVADAGIFKGLPSITHGDELETSCILHLQKKLVHRKKIRDQTHELDQELLRYLPISSIVQKTHTGKPSRATSEHGRRAIQFMLEEVVRRIRASVRKMARHRKNRK